MAFRLRQARARQRIRQEDLAAAAGISRQALSALEADRASPSTPVALRLAEALGLSVEALFGRPRRAQRPYLRAVGCDPALAMLAGQSGDLAGRARLRWDEGSSGEALDALQRGEAQIAGTHLRDNRAAAATLGASLFPFARWELGLVSLKGGGLRGAAQLGKARLVRREPGAGAQLLLERELALARVPPRPGPFVRGHLAVARAVALGEADAGVTTRAAARAWGLAFTPWSEERFDLLVPDRLLRDRRVQRVLDVLHGRSFRRELSALEGYRLP